MADANNIDKRFGDIAVEMALVSSEKLERALLVQRFIRKRTDTQMPIGKVLKEMGLLSEEQIDAILAVQRNGNDDLLQTSGGNAPGTENVKIDRITGLELSITDDRLKAFIAPTGEPLDNVSLETVKTMIADHGVVEGLVSDEALADYLKTTPLPIEPFQVARGTPPTEAVPAKICYHFDTDPLRIGTLLEDGTMDWKNRGEIPEVKAGDLLAEKVGGIQGIPGRSVFGKDIAPQRVREPQLKNGKGAERSEDKTQIIAKADGTPKLTSDGRIVVFTLLPIEGDIGVETGNIDFDGYVEAGGAVMAGYSVKAKGLRTREIQNAEIVVEEDLACDMGVYGTTIAAGGNIKAGHIHNCKITVGGDLVIEREIFGSTVEVSGRCFVENGKIIACTIKAKKGIQVKDVGTIASKPSELIVGIDFKNERETAAAKIELAELEKKANTLEATKNDMQTGLDKVLGLLQQLAQEQDEFIKQKHRFEDQLNGPDAVQDEEERSMLRDLIAELTEQTGTMNQKRQDLTLQKDPIQTQLADIDQTAESVDKQIETVKMQLDLLEEALKLDPGLPLIKVSGTIFERTRIVGPHKKMTLQERMDCVRIAESESDTGGKWELSISSLR